ncbi:hypothetical protein MKUB_43800 [Mycobacterium kubicae]|uniref:Helix-turn-helix domain-containing protein n=1 Tax=Mycobacterium kubicae TaxID=120959 RepID=A0ABQ1BT42_9MYCO|nr:helix-turn-helix domain-containing protein [Mycobacterium kubicae]ORW06253.1 hypothetical protein AWC13_00040 [Mycobacterium kubicae]GFG66890.1 hypothetical protein MKUB_43800 [Mycobacterium kubicae]
MPRKTEPSAARPELIGIQEAADRLGVSYRSVRRYISAGRLNAVRVGPRLLKVRADDLDALMRPVGGAA